MEVRFEIFNLLPLYQNNDGSSKSNHIKLTKIKFIIPTFFFFTQSCGEEVRNNITLTVECDKDCTVSFMCAVM